MRYNINNELKVKIFLILSIGILFCLIGISPVEGSLNNNSKIENIIEDKDSLNQSFGFGRDVSLYFLFGPIYNLSIDSDYYDFSSHHLLGLIINRYWYTSFVWDFQFRFFNIKGNFHFGLGSKKFFGILEPDFVCGCFRSKINNFFWV